MSTPGPAEQTIQQPCDGCYLTGVECPGDAVHCARGEHCNATDASCAASYPDDHFRCCFCQVPL